MNKEFISILDRSKEIHIKKNQDYTSGMNVDENFERIAEIVSWFNNPIDKSFASFIAVKLARIASLLNKSNKPNFESIDDTFIDLVTYAGLWGGNVARRLMSVNEIGYGYTPKTIKDIKNLIDDSLSKQYGIIEEKLPNPLKLEINYDYTNPKHRKIAELINLESSLDDNDYSQLLSLARILKSRKV